MTAPKEQQFRLMPYLYGEARSQVSEYAFDPVELVFSLVWPIVQTDLHQKYRLASTRAPVTGKALFYGNTRSALLQKVRQFQRLRQSGLQQTTALNYVHSLARATLYLLTVCANCTGSAR